MLKPNANKPDDLNQRQPQPAGQNLALTQQQRKEQEEIERQNRLQNKMLQTSQQLIIVRKSGYISDFDYRNDLQKITVKMSNTSSQSRSDSPAPPISREQAPAYPPQQEGHSA